MGWVTPNTRSLYTLGERPSRGSENHLTLGLPPSSGAGNTHKEEMMKPAWLRLEPKWIHQPTYSP